MSAHNSSLPSQESVDYIPECIQRLPGFRCGVAVKLEAGLYGVKL